jgi:hypothetical protein
MLKFVYNPMYHTLTKMLGNKRSSSISVSPHELDQLIFDLQKIKEQLSKQGLV